MNSYLKSKELCELNYSLLKWYWCHLKLMVRTMLPDGSFKVAQEVGLIILSFIRYVTIYSLGWDSPYPQLTWDYVVKIKPDQYPAVQQTSGFGEKSESKNQTQK